MGEITQLLEQSRRGDAAAWDDLVSALHDELLRVAYRVKAGDKGGTLNATALVNECYLRLAPRQGSSISGREHFLAVAGRAMRQILVNHARDRVAAKRGGNARRITLDEEAVAADMEADDLLALNDALNRLDTEDSRLPRIVDCRVFGGLTESETAAALNISLRTVQRLWRTARQKLGERLDA